MLLFRGYETYSGSVVKAAGAIALTEVVTKVLLHYFHDRVWSPVHRGSKRAEVNQAISPMDPQ